MQKRGGKNRQGRKQSGPGASLRTRLGRITLGDMGEAIAGAWEGIGKVTGFNQEIKRLDFSSGAPGVVTNVGVMNSVSLIAEGSDYNQRDGHSVKALSLELRALATPNSVAVLGGNDVNYGRLITFLDLEQNGTQPTAAQLLETTATSSAALAPFQHDNTERFVILDDWFFLVGAGGPDGLTHTARIRLNSHIRYSGSTATDGAAREGHLYVLLMGDQAANGPYMSFYTRLSYVDN